MTKHEGMLQDKMENQLNNGGYENMLERCFCDIFYLFFFFFYSFWKAASSSCDAFTSKPLLGLHFSGVCFILEWVECTKHQKSHWPGLETLCLFSQQDLLEGLQHMRRCISQQPVLHHVLADAMYRTVCFSDFLLVHICLLVMLSQLLLSLSSSHTWDLEVLTSTTACVLIQGSNHWL